MPTKIEWATETWNPVTGCTGISEGCANCYARRMAQRLRGRCGYDRDEPFKVTVHADRLSDPLGWRKPRIVFVCSMGDLFHKDVPIDIILRVFEIVGSCPSCRFLFLTKRPERMASAVNVAADRLALGFPHRNAWFGVSIENQDVVDWRIDRLLETPGNRFVSCEPLLGPVSLERAFAARSANGSPAIGWVICGGESGPGARPMHPAWARNLRDQCAEAGVPFFFKQWGEWAPESKISGSGQEATKRIDLQGRDITNEHGLWRESDATMVRVGRQRAGRALDGRLHEEWPDWQEDNNAPQDTEG